MSESAYYGKEVSRFRAEHPAEAGWKVSEVNSSETFGILSLPEFLKDHAPQALKKMDIVRRVVRGPEDLENPAGKLKLKEWSWRGEIEVDWSGEPLHFRSTTLVSSGSPIRATTFVAAKSFSALDEMIRELNRYITAKRKSEKTIKIISGRSNKDIPKPKLGWSDLCLPDEMAGDIRGAVDSFFKAKEKYLRFGLAYRRGFLFSGPPGGGKTLTAQIIAATQDASCVAYFPRNGPSESDSLESAFAMAESLAPTILILEDLDKFDRTIPIARMLNILDGLDTPRGILVIATTNEPGRLDPALLLRPSRFDRVWNFPLPDYERRLVLLTKKSKGAFSARAMQLAARMSHGFSMAYVQEVLATAVAYSVSAERDITDEDLLRSVAVLREQIKKSKAAQPQIGAPEKSVGFLPEGAQKADERLLNVIFGKDNIGNQEP